MKIVILVPDDRDELRRYADPDPYFGTAPTALLEGLAQCSDCEVHIVSCTQRELRAPAKLAANTCFHSLLVPKWGWLRGGYIGCVRAVKKKLREIRPDVVHGQGTERYCALAAVLSGFPNVLTIHGNMRNVARVYHARPFSFLWLAARLERWTLPKTCGVLCNSDYTLRLVSPLARATWKVPNALREIFFSPQPVSCPPPILLNVGEISLLKSQNELLDMAARLHRRGAKFEIHFIGRVHETTSYGAEFLSRIRLAEREGYAKYLPFKSKEELVAAMDGASAVLHFPKEEAFGLVVAEGLARNLKLFGARVGGVVDIATGVEGAELIDPGDFDALEAAIFQWLSMGSPKIKTGAEQMRQRYHPSVIARRHLEIYQEITRLYPGGG